MTLLFYYSQWQHNENKITQHTEKEAPSSENKYMSKRHCYKM